MGIPSVLLVATLASIGFWWTIQQPADSPPPFTNTSSMPEGDVIERGCFLLEESDGADPCSGVQESPLLDLRDNPTGYRIVCQQSWDESYFLEVWEDPLGKWRLHWNLPPSADETAPLSSAWIIAWSGTPDFGSALRVGGVAKGWAMFPATPAPDRDVTILAGAVSLTGALQDGLDAFEVIPFDFDGIGGVRLAAFVDGGSLVLEIPAHEPYDIVQTQESLHFRTSPDLGMSVPRCQ